MAKLKLGAIIDEKPVKLTVELPAAVHRDLLVYAKALARGNRAGGRRRLETRRADAGTVHGDGPRVYKDSAQKSSRGRGIELSQQLQETR
jgi:hypothetical protein